MDALGQGGVPQLQLRSESTPSAPQPTTIALPGVVASGTYPSRWVPASVQGVHTVQGVQGVREREPFEPLERLEPRERQVSAKPLIPLGQFRDTFIVAIDDEGVAIIDQHVAHERVPFERVMERLTAGTLESQRLLVPMVVELSVAEHDVLVARGEELGRFGFEIESFGGASLKVTAMPALLEVTDCEQALLGLAHDLEGLDRGAKIQDALQRIAATTACHAAVKANYPLTYEKMAHILDELRATAYSTVCPHGRPVMLRLTRREIEKNFERI